MAQGWAGGLIGICMLCTAARPHTRTCHHQDCDCSWWLPLALSHTLRLGSVVRSRTTPHVSCLYMGMTLLCQIPCQRPCVCLCVDNCNLQGCDQRASQEV
jgi:hypothetical protein